MVRTVPSLRPNCQIHFLSRSCGDPTAEISRVNGSILIGFEESRLDWRHVDRVLADWDAGVDEPLRIDLDEETP